jgi:hypothetical protein
MCLSATCSHTPELRLIPELHPASELCSTPDFRFSPGLWTPQDIATRAGDDLFMLLLLVVTNQTAKTLSDMIKSAASAGLDKVKEAFNRVLATLANFHGQAAYIGRQKAGVLAPYGESDSLFGQLVAAGQSKFLGRFFDAIANADPRYVNEDGSLNSAAIERRSGWYGLRTWGTANEAWTRSLHPATVIEWVLGGNEDHCETCPRLAAGGPYTPYTLPTYPRAGDTDCLMNCLCHLRTEDGRTSFMPII